MGTKKTIILNASNALGAGAKVVIKNIITSMPSVSPNTQFIAILPDIEFYHNIPDYNNLEKIFIPQGKFRLLRRYWDLKYGISSWVKTLKANICFTLGDLGPARINIPHYVLLHQAFIIKDAYEDVLGNQSILTRLHYYFAKRQFNRMIPNISGVFVQTPKMLNGLLDCYKIEKSKAHLVLHALPQHILEPVFQSFKIFDYLLKHENGEKYLLFLAAGYEHKNHKILPEVIDILIYRKVYNFKIIITIDGESNKNEAKILHSLTKYSDYIVNIGRVDPAYVPAVFLNTDALFMPSTIESLGIIYLEAMYFDKPILTSDRDFSHWVCGDYAMYFEPKNPVSVADAIEKFISDGPPSKYLGDFHKRLAKFPKSWREVTEKYLELILKSQEPSC